MVEETQEDQDSNEQRACSGCEWKGTRAECVWLGEIGPLCPECNETTEVETRPYDMEFREGNMVSCPNCQRPASCYSRTRSGRVRYFKCRGSSQGPGCNITFKITQGQVIL